MRYDAKRAAARWNLVNDLFGVFILDLHEHLTLQARRHRAQIENQDPADLEQKLNPLTQYAPIPVTESDSQSLSANGTWGSDSVLRSSALQRWAHEGQIAFPSEVRLSDKLKVVPGVVFLGLLVLALGRRVFRGVG